MTLNQYLDCIKTDPFTASRRILALPFVILSVWLGTFFVCLGWGWIAAMHYYQEFG